jgi:hypothetical protein
MTNVHETSQQPPGRKLRRHSYPAVINQEALAPIVESNEHFFTYRQRVGVD